MIGQKGLQTAPGQVINPINDEVRHKGSLSPDINPETYEAVADTQIRGLPDAMYGPANERLTTTDTSHAPSQNFKQDIKPGPVDPLTGQDTRLESAGLMGPKYALAEFLLQQILTVQNGILMEIRGLNPQLPCVLSCDNGTALTSGVAKFVNFQLEGKNVPALSVTIQNNTGNVIYYDFDRTATTGSFVLANGFTSTSAEKCERLSILTTSNATIGGASGVVIRALSNPEYTRAWGQA